MRPTYLAVTMATADRNGVCTAQSKAAAGNLTIDGDLATSGVATMDVPRHVSVYAAGNNSGVTFTVTGTNRDSVAMTESITGPNATTVKGNKNFLTITQVAVDAATTGNVEVGSADELESKVIPVDHYAPTLTYSVKVSSGASLTHNFKFTTDNVQASTFDESTAKWYDDLGTDTEDIAYASIGGITAVRLAITNFVSGIATLGIITPKN